MWFLRQCCLSIYKAQHIQLQQRSPPLLILSNCLGTMSICQTCKNIPWHKLPVTRKEAVPHQPTLAALEKSATECPLCRLIWLEYQQALRKPSVSYDQRYIDGLLRDRELPRTQIRVYGREDQIGLIHFKVHEIGFEIAVGTHDGTVTVCVSCQCQLV